MTIFDLAFLIAFLAVIAVISTGAAAALLDYKRVARSIFTCLGAGAIAYVGLWIVLTVLSKQAPLKVGDPQCADNWCVAVEDVQSAREGQTITYDVALCLFSRAQRTVTSFGAHNAPDPSNDFQLVDDSGRHYQPLPHDSEVPLGIVLHPGQAVRTRRRFELPADARGIRVLIAKGPFGACPVLGECSTSHPASDYVVASGVYQPGSSFLALVHQLQRNAKAQPTGWR